MFNHKSKTCVVIRLDMYKNLRSNPRRDHAWLLTNLVLNINENHTSNYNLMKGSIMERNLHKLMFKLHTF